VFQKVRSWFCKLIAPFLFSIYKKQIIRVMEKATKDQMKEVQDMIVEALESGLELNIIINPTMMAGMGMYLEDNEEEEKKENPFKLVKDDEQE